MPIRDHVAQSDVLERHWCHEHLVAFAEERTHALAVEVERAFFRREPDLQLTREYLIYLRERMGAAVQEFVPFEEAYAETDWSRFSHLPAFNAANRRNAYNTYLLMEREALAR